jgi:tetratricopeptide (TPR) repeat protein
MLAKKISFNGAIIFVALSFCFAGCTPAGPRALLKGKKSLDHGDYVAAVEQLKTATTLLATNAQAWNYYGVALQLAGHPDDAATAYQTALKFDRDLVEAHFNLGSLALEQNKPETAKSEFTAYRLRRPNDAAGWLKLGAAQLKLGESGAAETSFSTVLALKSNNEAEAYNGLGLARVKGGQPRDAAKFFAEAVKSRADFAPAILNLATVNQQYLRDNKAALENYRAYLALKPRPANWDEVNSLASSLEPAEIKIAAVTPTVEKPVPPAPEPKPQPKVTNVVPPHPAVAPKPQTPVKVVNPSPPEVKPVPVQVVEVKPATQIVTVPLPAKVAPAAPVEPPLVVPMPADPPGKSFLGKLFTPSPAKEPPVESKYLGQGLTPLPASPEPAVKPAARPLEAMPAPAPVFVMVHYNYFNPRKPAAGDRSAATGAFTKARLFEQEEKWLDALQWYQQAAALDPTWFEAQYNTGVLAQRLRNFALALPRYEMALAIQPESADARYNFALALKAAGYPADAAEQLKKILAVNPRETRAHLALANISAQSRHDAPQARQHYLKVLELDPENQQASDIRFWLSANPR